MSIFDALSDIPAAAVEAVVTLIGGIIKVARAGDDAQARADALMETAEKLKAHADDAKFGPRAG